jgi:hypothetical protein
MYPIIYVYGGVRYNYFYGTQKRDLANLFGINLVEFEQEKRFPYQYFYDNLADGMTVREVHQIMRRYEKVLKCGDFAEIYYYFSTDEELAYRYLVGFEQGKYIGSEYGGLQAHEGPMGDSWIPGYKDGCVDGLLDE